MDKKSAIYFSRTYRHLRLDKTKSFLYILLFIIPSIIIFVMNISNLTELMSVIGVKILGQYFPGIAMQIVQSELALLGHIEFIDLPTVFPQLSFSFLNAVVTALLILFFGTGRRKGHPISIYIIIGLVVHFINCIYFIFAGNYFPYSSFRFSDLYMKQQVGVWIAIMVLLALTTAFFGSKGFKYKIMLFIGVMVYSVIFGMVRYIFFMFILQKFSVLYMALMFFAFGPFFDFLYLVGGYSFFADRMVTFFDNSEEGRGEWRWS